MAKSNKEDLRIIESLEEQIKQVEDSKTYWYEKYMTSEEERKELREKANNKWKDLQTKHSTELDLLKLENLRLWHIVRGLVGDKTLPRSFTDKDGREFPIDTFPLANQPFEITNPHAAWNG